ncbi:MAG: hypothetical protein A2Y33_00200 [Spirochaetes bacterium GWF1_51_8]|nr:MAG: hypothetical protein A2Y33_00200 [Spirochaetes bacterium GWF1_51_8]
MNKKEFENLLAHLPRDPGILGREDYFNPAVLIPFVEMPDGYHILFEVRAKHIPQGGEVCFPGGRYQPGMDSSLMDTALREASEELGIVKDKIEILGRTDAVVSPYLMIVDAFIGIIKIESLGDIKPDPMEVECVFTIPVEFFRNNPPEVYQGVLCSHPCAIDGPDEGSVLFPAKELGLPERYTKPWGKQRYNIYYYRTDPPVWGITARFIKDLIDKMG